MKPEISKQERKKLINNCDIPVTKKRDFIFTRVVFVLFCHHINKSDATPGGLGDMSPHPPGGVCRASEGLLPQVWPSGNSRRYLQMHCSSFVGGEGSRGQN